MNTVIMKPRAESIGERIRQESDSYRDKNPAELQSLVINLKKNHDCLTKDLDMLFNHLPPGKREAMQCAFYRELNDVLFPFWLILEAEIPEEEKHDLELSYPFNTS